MQKISLISNVKFDNERKLCWYNSNKKFTIQSWQTSTGGCYTLEEALLGTHRTYQIRKGLLFGQRGGEWLGSNFVGSPFYKYCLVPGTLLLWTLTKCTHIHMTVHVANICSTSTFFWLSYRLSQEMMIMNKNSWKKNHNLLSQFI